MRRYIKQKKGHLILEVVVYLAIVSILMMCVMNLGIFIIKQHNQSVKKLADKVDFISLDERIKGIINSPINNVKVKVNEANDKRPNNIEVYEIGEYNQNNNTYIYFEAGNIRIENEKLEVGGVITGDDDVVNLEGDLENIIITEDRNLIYIEYIFVNIGKKVGVYEK
ncbi:hypothetical protein [uncultured Clostridium sp.]|uniref:hypothetical protein n=1 Tax=uncultured Clostridium sp. TaxID=59620 RepID=UPI002605A5F1|nr:hypothetical protein [uncultured Clostridium sp.]